VGIVEEGKIVEIFNNGINSVILLVRNMEAEFNAAINQQTSGLINLNTTIAHQNKEIEDLIKSNLEMRLKLIELEARLNKNSSNSSKPPSSDGYKKPKIANSRVKSNKKTGGQIGHTGSTLNKIATPDKVVEMKVENFCSCNYDLRNLDSSTETRQVFDIPKIILEVIEYIIHKKVCPICGKVHKTEFPAHVKQPVQYGANMQTLMVYLKDYQFLSLKRTAEAIKDITGQKVSEGTIVNASEQLSVSLEKVMVDIKSEIKNSEVIHCDETGIRVRGKTQWLHVASTATSTHYEVHEKRGYEATSHIGILPGFIGTIVHDHWMPLYKYTECTHAECNAHNIRYLIDIFQNYKQEWANSMMSLLIELHRRVGSLKSEGITSMDPDETYLWYGRYHTIINEGIVEDEAKSPKVFSKKGKLQKSKALRLLLKIQDYDIETLAFMYDFNVPFDNNQAERDLRMPKLRQKVSGCFRGKNSEKIFCRIRSYISTARKRGQTAFEAIQNAVKGVPMLPEV
jgi:transposase